MLKATLIGCVLMVASVSTVRAEDDPLDKLSERYTAQEKRYEEAEKQAKTDQERKKISESLDPIHALVGDFVAIEQTYRGNPAAISVLYQLMRNAAFVGDPDIPASQGRVKAVQILRDHYLEHPDLDLLLLYFTSGDFVPAAEALLRDATRSPHQHVRAAARYQLARFLAYKARIADLFGPGSLPPDSTTDLQPGMVDFRRRMLVQAKELAIDPKSERKKAVDLVEQIIAEDPEVVQLLVKQEGPGNLGIRRASAEELGGTPIKYAKLADAMRFDLVHLQLGQVVPEIAGKDADGMEFKLSDYRGRVVLLMFSANWCAPCKAMYPDIRKLQVELEMEPFAALAVMGDHQIDSIIQDTKDGHIRWRTWFDGDSDAIAKAWHIQSWPTVFLLDHNGIIVDREAARSYAERKKAIDALLAARKADPEAEATLNAHPLPALPILKRAK